MIIMNDKTVNMEIKSLSKEVITKLRSTSNIRNLTQCVSELVLNSLDAKSSAIAIRLNSISFRIQVIDNGIGISEENLEKIARKYYTNKCQSLLDLEKKPNFYGFRGESLWSISNVSKTMNITSKHSESEKTFSKNISARKLGKVTVAKKRQSNGSTITIDGFFYSLPVRQKRVKREFELDEIVNFLEKMSLIHPQVSITLRDDITGKLLFKRPKSENIIKSLTVLYPDVKYDETIVMKVRKDKITVEALLSKEIYKEKIIQHLYVNKRPVCHHKLQTFLCKELAKDKKDNLPSVNSFNPMFIMNIKCSLANYHVMYENSEARVEFLNIDLIYRCIEKLILNFFGKSKPIKKVDGIPENRKSICGVSDLVGTVKGFGFKDWLKRKEINEGASAIIEEVEHSENQPEFAEPKRKQKNCEVKNKLKSLPIKIYDQNNDKSKRIRVEENETKNKRTIKNIGEHLQQSNMFIVRSTPNINNAGQVMMDNFRRLEKNCRDITSKQKHDETLFSHFTNTEEKGKDLIMYMFLKSTELFNEDLSPKPLTQVSEENSYGKLDSSKETIMESNLFFENVTRTRTHQLNKTISVSVRLKRRKNVAEKSNFPEISFSIPMHKKRRIEYLEGHLKRDNKDCMSPYFMKNVDHCCIPKKKIVDREIQVGPDGNFERYSEKHISSVKMWNSFMNYGNNMKTNMFCTEKLDNKNIANTCFMRNNDMKKCFDRMSMVNDCFFKFTNQAKQPFYDCNQSYLFNFESTSLLRNADLGNSLQFNEEFKPENFEIKNKLSSNDRNYDLKRNFSFKNFDFGNISLSPIPKMKNFPQNMELPAICEPAYQLPKSHVTNFRKYVSEGEVLKVSSPYFSKEKFKYRSKNHENFLFSLTNKDTPQNQIEGTAMEKFRRYHTEPLDDSRFQYIQNVKNKIDKIFMAWKCNRLPERNNIVKVFNNLNKEETEVYTVDSLEKDKNKHNMQSEKNEGKNLCPLWKRFMRNKNKSVGTCGHLRRYSPSHNKNNHNKLLQKKCYSFERRHTSPIKDDIEKSPDLFSDVKLNSMNGEMVKDLTLLPNSAVSFDVDVTEKINVDPEKDLATLTAIGTVQSSNLIITLDMEDKYQKKLGADPEIDGGFSKTNSAGNQWLKRIDHEGNEFYLNRKTGMTSFLHPKTEVIYNFKHRPEYMPKGLSPLLIPVQKLERSLSPISKEKLHDEILKSYVDDLGLIKWEKYIKGYDPKKFFENLYNERVHNYEKEIPNIMKTKISKLASTSFSDQKFSKIVFKDIRVIGQIDQKFIVSIDEKKFDLIIFDQHAVHERIRLEDLLKEYQGKCAACGSVTLFMNQVDVELLIKHTKYLNGIGIHFRNLTNGITVYEVPSCLLNKVTKEVNIFVKEGDIDSIRKSLLFIISMMIFARRIYRNFGIYLKQGRLIYREINCTLLSAYTAYESYTECFTIKWTNIYKSPLPKLIQLLIREFLEFARNTRGVCTGLPRMLNQIINMEACRGAVKFGESLQMNEMKGFVEKLSRCILPFQCAHGRPTLVPLLTLNTAPKEIVLKPNLRNLKKI